MPTTECIVPLMWHRASKELGVAVLPMLLTNFCKGILIYLIIVLLFFLNKFICQILINHVSEFQIRHASVERLLDRLTDLRFLSIDFLNTFLLTYRVFTTSQTVMNALRRIYRYPEYGNIDPASSAVLHPNRYDRRHDIT